MASSQRAPCEGRDNLLWHYDWHVHAATPMAAIKFSKHKERITRKATKTGRDLTVESARYRKQGASCVVRAGGAN